jgi:hypothetical protein
MMKVDHMPGAFFISFRRSDMLPGHIEPFFAEYAERIRKMNRNHLPDFCRMIYTSRHWNIENLESKLSDWEQRFGKVRGSAKLIELVKRSFSECRDDNEINILRGLILEAIVAACHGGAAVLQNQQYGWGCVVVVRSSTDVIEEIKYTCNNPTPLDQLDQCRDVCKNRQTIDFGYWDGNHALLYECKVSPEGIGCKEINFFNILKSRLNEYSISNELFFVCADSSEHARMYLEEKQIGQLIKPLGYRELLKMLPA